MSHSLPRRRPVTQERAKELRQTLTSTEELVWSLVRGKRLGQLKFYRQVPIGPYIADFYCPGSKLVVELDGDTHDLRVAQDANRTAYLSRLELQVLRISNDDVISNLEGVGVAILNAAGCDPRPWLDGESRRPPFPNPLPKGRGDKAEEQEVTKPKGRSDKNSGGVATTEETP